MPQTSKATRLNFSSNAAKTCRAGLDFMRDGLALAFDYADLYAGELTAGDYAESTLDGMDPADVATLVGALQQIDAILSAADGAARKAVKRLAQFAR